MHKLFFILNKNKIYMVYIETIPKCLQKVRQIIFMFFDDNQDKRIDFHEFCRALSICINSD